MDELVNNKCKHRVFFVTVAFGIGIDCPNIRRVVHLGVPYYHGRVFPVLFTEVSSRREGCPRVLTHSDWHWSLIFFSVCSLIAALIPLIARTFLAMSSGTPHFTVHSSFSLTLLLSIWALCMTEAARLMRKHQELVTSWTISALLTDKGRRFASHQFTNNHIRLQGTVTGLENTIALSLK